MNDTIYIDQNLIIPSNELDLKFSRSGGKGGQNVNKLETKVELIYDVARSTSLTESQRDLAIRNLRTKLDSVGKLHIISQESRSQWKNRETALRKFIKLMQRSLIPPKKRIKTKVSRSHKENRLISKKRRGEIKKMRKVRLSD